MSVRGDSTNATFIVVVTTTTTTTTTTTITTLLHLYNTYKYYCTPTTPSITIQTSTQYYSLHIKRNKDKKENMKG